MWELFEPHKLQLGFAYTWCASWYVGLAAWRLSAALLLVTSG